MEHRGNALSVAIIGAGFSGTLLAVHIMKNAKRPIEVSLLERRGEFGRGLAYSTGNPSHLLNVRAANMSAFPDDTAHFLRWLWQRDDLAAPKDSVPPGGDAFVPRGLYGAYLEETLRDAAKAARRCVSLKTIAGEVTGIHPTGGRWRLQLADGSAAEADTVVLCVGHFAPRLPCPAIDPELGPPTLILDPWDEAALRGIATDAKVAIVGTGLTMVDTVLSLLDQRHSGPIIALSRRGLLPQRHAEARIYEDFLGARRYMPATALGTLRILRAEVRAAHAEGYSWRSVIDAVRPHTQRIWVGLPPEERRRFLRHLRPYWEVHRHRMAPTVACRLWDARDRGQFDSAACRLQRIERRDGRVAISYRPRGGGELRLMNADAVINCSGPECDFTHVSHPLIAGLLERGLMRADPLGLGIETTVQSQVVGADGQPVPGLLAIGPIARGAFWEMTAVPELRNACAIVGQRLAMSPALPVNAA